MTLMNQMTVLILLRPAEAAEMLGFSRSKVYAMLASAELPAIRAGRSVRIPRAALEAWIVSNTIGGSQAAALGTK